MKLTRRTFLLTETQTEMMRLIQEKYGIKNMTGVFDRALQDCYNSTFKYNYKIKK